MAGRTRPEPYFLTEKPDDDVALAGAEARAGQLKIFKQYCFDPSEVEGGEILGNRDHDRETSRLSQLAGINKRAAEEGIYAYQTLRRLPRLREMQLATARLDLDRLSAVAAAIGCLGPDAPAEAYEAFDDALVEMFTPVKTRQALPARNTITLRLNKMIGDFDTEAAFDLAKKKNRKRTTPGAPQIDFGPGAAGSDEAWMTLSADNASIAALRSNINEAARKEKVTQAEAAIKLLTGDITPAATATIYAYTPKGADGGVDESSASFIPGFGYTGASGSAMLHLLAEKFGTTVIDLDAAATKVVAGHDAPADMAAFVRGRDGTCIFPGCTRPATNCQLDHRIPSDEGGPTTASNLFCLCQHHHNCKTDRGAFYVQDALTGEIIWLYDDGTYQRIDPDSITGANLTPTNPRWRRTLDDVERLRKKATHFHAKSHTILDGYENKVVAYDPYLGAEREAAWSAYRQCQADLEKLAAQYDLKFPFDPVPPRWIPDDELDAPDPEAYTMPEETEAAYYTD